MADQKISQLPAATTPLAGTEVLPIVQGTPAVTVKVSSDNLTVRNIRAAATTGILQVSGPTAGTTRLVTVPDANFTVARTDAANSFIGNQTLSTGDIIQGTAAKGFTFSANTPAAGMTSQLLNWYEEGTWTPILTFGGASVGIIYDGNYKTGYYTRIGNLVHVSGIFALTSKGTSTGAATIGGLPFAIKNNLAAYSAVSIEIGNITFTGQCQAVGNITTTYISLTQITEAGTRSMLTDANFTNTSQVILQFSYNV